MIAKLRRRHRWMSALMGVAALGGLGVALASRVPPPVMPALPAPLAKAAQPEGAPLLDSATLWTGASIHTTRYPDALVLTPLEPLRVPDPLLYYSHAPPLSEALPGDARLLGAVSDAPDQLFPLPPGLSGHLILYSLGHDRVVAHAPMGAP